jgi:hypothetical protein
MAEPPKPKKKRKAVGGRKPIVYDPNREVSYEAIKAWREAQGKPLKETERKFPKWGQ